MQTTDTTTTDAIDHRLTDLEIKASYTEDLLDQLNLTVYRQQQQIDDLVRELLRLRQQVPEGSGAAPRNRSARTASTNSADTATAILPSASEVRREECPAKFAWDSIPDCTDVVCDAAVAASDWPHAYDRERAAYPLASLRRGGGKYWSPVGRVDNVQGDRNLFCACPPVSAYEA